MNVRLKRARELAGYAVQLTKDEGLPTMLKRGAGFVKRRCFGKRARYLPAKKVLEAQRAEMADKTAADCGLPTISILTPLYNTPEKYLREFLDSFVNQTAPNGQLCLADASDAEHADVKRIVEEYQTKNQRIVYKKIENKGIAANTNAAAELATGEYLALADHDDILAPHAMYTMGKAILQLRAQGEPEREVVLRLRAPEAYPRLGQRVQKPRRLRALDLHPHTAAQVYPPRAHTNSTESMRPVTRRASLSIAVSSSASPFMTRRVLPPFTSIRSRE